jgi:hypothetical protein
VLWIPSNNGNFSRKTLAIGPAMSMLPRRWAP